MLTPPGHPLTQSDGLTLTTGRRSSSRYELSCVAMSKDQ